MGARKGPASRLHLPLPWAQPRGRHCRLAVPALVPWTAGEPSGVICDSRRMYSQSGRCQWRLGGAEPALRPCYSPRSSGLDRGPQVALEGAFPPPRLSPPISASCSDNSRSGAAWEGASWSAVLGAWCWLTCLFSHLRGSGTCTQTSPGGPGLRPAVPPSILGPPGSCAQQIPGTEHPQFPQPEGLLLDQRRAVGRLGSAPPTVPPPSVQLLCSLAQEPEHAPLHPAMSA